MATRKKPPSLPITQPETAASAFQKAAGAAATSVPAIAAAQAIASTVSGLVEKADAVERVVNKKDERAAPPLPPPPPKGGDSGEDLDDFPLGEGGESDDDPYLREGYYSTGGEVRYGSFREGDPTPPTLQEDVEGTHTLLTAELPGFTVGTGVCCYVAHSDSEFSLLYFAGASTVPGPSYRPVYLKFCILQDYVHLGKWVLNPAGFWKWTDRDASELEESFDNPLPGSPLPLGQFEPEYWWGGTRPYVRPVPRHRPIEGVLEEVDHPTVPLFSKGPYPQHLSGPHAEIPKKNDRLQDSRRLETFGPPQHDMLGDPLPGARCEMGALQPAQLTGVSTGVLILFGASFSGKSALAKSLVGTRFGLNEFGFDNPHDVITLCAPLVAAELGHHVRLDAIRTLGYHGLQGDTTRSGGIPSSLIAWADGARVAAERGGALLTAVFNPSSKVASEDIFHSLLASVSTIIEVTDSEWVPDQTGEVPVLKSMTLLASARPDARAFNLYKVTYE